MKIIRTFLTTIYLIASSAQAGMPAVTTESIGKPYKIIDGACVYSEAEKFSFSGDPIEKAVHTAFEKMDVYGKKVGADALVKFDIDFANRTQKDEGRVILCGTLVKYK